MFAGSDYNDLIFDVLVKAFIVIFFMPMHNIVQARVASFFGDHTAADKGFYTMAPQLQIEPRAVLAFVIFGFSWTRKVPRNFNKDNSKRPIVASMLTTLSGPLVYLLITIIFIFIAHLAFPTDYFSPSQAITPFRGNSSPFYVFINKVAFTLILLFLVQLLPIRPFDGESLITIFIPGKVYYKLISFVQNHNGLFTVLFIVVIAPAISFLGQLLSVNVFSFIDLAVTNIINMF